MKKFCVLLSFITIFSANIFSQSVENPRVKWFVDARYGMFIHWGLYSAAEGIWKGEKLRNNNDYAEWIQYRNRISKEEYIKLVEDIDWDNVKPEEWVKQAWKAGMKYVIFTSKHHDGFALWDSKVSNYNVGTYTNHKRDIVKEVADACHKYGLKFGLYYSHWLDWEHPYGWDHTKEVYPVSQEEYDKYWQEKVIPQIKELLTNYGKVDIMWFDMWINHKSTIVSKEELVQLKNLIRKLQPDCLINSRLGLSLKEDPDVDFLTMGDNEMGRKVLNFPWQTPVTIAKSWGYSAYDNNWKSTTTLLHYLINNVSLNGNLLVNIGPRANGDIPFEISQRLNYIGNWLAVNGDAIYGSSAFELPPEMHDWGRITFKEEDGKSKVFLNVYNWPLNKKLTVTGIKAKPEKVYFLADKEKTPIKVNFNEVVNTIDLSLPQPDPIVSVIVMEFDKKPETESDLVAKNEYGGFSLTPFNYVSLQGDKSRVMASNFGSVPAHFVVKNKSEYKWRIYIDEPGEKNISISYGYGDKGKGGNIKVNLAGKTFNKEITNTGLFVVEPGNKRRLTDYKSFNLGNVGIQKPGYYDVTVEITPDKGKEVDFQWVWIE